MIFDTHSHCYWDTLLPNIDNIVLRMQENGVQKATQIGCDINTSKQAIALAQRFPHVFYATVGLHPETAQNESIEESIMEQELDALITRYREYTVAVGECGFDFHYLDGTDNGTKSIDMAHLSPQAIQQIENQKYWWLMQAGLANKYNLPLVIHTRDARNETLDFMKKHNISRAVMHCFSEDADFAHELLAFSSEIYFSFSGILTYKKSEKIQDAARSIPLSRILIETDAPFLSPQKVRGTLNEPMNTRHVLDALIGLRTESPDCIEATVYENSLRFYGI